MRFTSWLGKRQRTAPSGRRYGTPRKRPTCLPQLEALEERTVPSGGYVFKTIDDPNGAPGFNVALGINSRGEIVGGYADAAGAVHGYLRSGGEYTTLDDPNAAGYTDAYAINARGEIVGSYRDASGFQHGFLLSKGHYTTLDDPNTIGFTVAQGINARGEVVGVYLDASFSLHGFLLSGGQYTNIDDPNGVTRFLAINNRGDIVGSYVDASGEHGFLLSHGQYTTLDAPNAVLTEVHGINDSGKIVGRYDLAGGPDQGFLMSGGQYTTLEDPNARGGTEAWGINDSGKIVGFYVDASGNEHGFLATKAHDDGHGDDAPAGASQAAGRASGDNADLLLPTVALTNATLTANQVITVVGGSGADRSDGSSDISTVPTWAAATLPSPLPGSGDSTGGRVRVVSTATATAGTDTGQPGNDVFARNDEVFRVGL
jgi:uncharacterized membrane protein